MNEIDLYRMLCALVPPAVAARNGGQPLGIMQAYQPTQQGAPTAPTVTMHTVSSVRYGWPKRYSVWDNNAGAMRHHEEQAMETTIQFTMRQSSAGSATAPTETDVIQLVADAVQSDTFIAAVYTEGVQLLRITDVRMGRFIGDNGQNMNWPSFDIVLKHSREYVNAAPVVSKWEGLHVRAVL